ncbi:MAG: hypothetical protein U1E15_12020 [Hyphomicrobiales bacterium]
MLYPGDIVYVQVGVRVDPNAPGAPATPFLNQVVGSATGADGSTIGDLSDDGWTSTNSGNPTSGTPTPFTPPSTVNPNVSLLKRAGTPVALGDGSFTVEHIEFPQTWAMSICMASFSRMISPTLPSLAHHSRRATLSSRRMW